MSTEGGRGRGQCDERMRAIRPSQPALCVLLQTRICNQSSPGGGYMGSTTLN